MTGIRRCSLDSLVADAAQKAVQVVQNKATNESINQSKVKEKQRVRRASLPDLKRPATAVPKGNTVKRVMRSEQKRAVIELLPGRRGSVDSFKKNNNDNSKAMIRPGTAMSLRSIVRKFQPKPTLPSCFCCHDSDQDKDQDKDTDKDKDQHSSEGVESSKREKAAFFHRPSSARTPAMGHVNSGFNRPKWDQRPMSSSMNRREESVFGKTGGGFTGLALNKTAQAKEPSQKILTENRGGVGSGPISHISACILKLPTESLSRVLFYAGATSSGHMSRMAGHAFDRAWGEGKKRYMYRLDYPKCSVIQHYFVLNSKKPLIQCARGLEFTVTGDLIIAEQDAARLLLIDSKKGNVLRRIGDNKLDFGVNGAFDVAIDPKRGSIYGVSPDNACVHGYDKNGNKIVTIGGRGSHSPNPYPNPDYDAKPDPKITTTLKSSH